MPTESHFTSFAFSSPLKQKERKIEIPKASIQVNSRTSSYYSKCMHIKGKKQAFLFPEDKSW